MQEFYVQVDCLLLGLCPSELPRDVGVWRDETVITAALYECTYAPLTWLWHRQNMSHWCSLILTCWLAPASTDWMSIAFLVFALQVLPRPFCGFLSANAAKNLFVSEPNNVTGRIFSAACFQRPSRAFRLASLSPFWTQIFHEITGQCKSQSAR